MCVTICLESREPPVGRLQSDVGETRTFAGWIELLALLEAWVVPSRQGSVLPGESLRAPD